MKLYEIVYEKYSLPRGVVSVARPIGQERYKGVCGRYVSQTWLDKVLNQSGFDERARNIYITHLRFFVLTAKRKILPIAELFQGLKQEDVLLVTLMGPNSAGNH